jgi:hypothetical protein
VSLKEVKVCEFCGTKHGPNYCYEVIWCDSEHEYEGRMVRCTLFAEHEGPHGSEMVAVSWS